MSLIFRNEVSSRPTIWSWRPSRRLVAGLIDLPVRYRRWRSRRRTLGRLAELDEHMLRDIGFTRAEAERELRRAVPWHLSFPWQEGAARRDLHGRW